MTPVSAAPAERPGLTRKFHLDGPDGSLSLYATKVFGPDGTVQGLSLTCNQQGTLERGLLHTLGRTATLALEAGVPAARLAREWRGIEFEPNGFTGDPRFPSVKSIVDWMARWLAEEPNV